MITNLKGEKNVSISGKQWVYGWTHYRMVGQTQARLHRLTREVEIKDNRKWVRCIADSIAFFTPNSKPANLNNLIS